MGLLNRSAVVVRPREPYLHWAKQDDSSGVAEAVFETLRAMPNAYLISEDEEAEGPMDLLGQWWTNVFEAMLEGWLTDRAMWPQNRTFAMFEEWFEVEACESVHDLVDEPLGDY